MDLADKLQYNFDNKYNSSIEYAYKLLLQNQAHDGICGCSTDLVHEENITRYKKVLQIANGIIDEISANQPKNLSITFKYLDKYKLLEIEKPEIDENSQVVARRKGFARELLCDVNRIPVTEDYTTIYTLLKEFNADGSPSDLVVDNTNIFNSNIRILLEDGKLNLYNKEECHKNFIEFIKCNDLGDTYNFGPDITDEYEIAEIKSARVILNGPLRSTLRINTSFFSVDVTLEKRAKLLKFKINWLNLSSNK